jgi:hypothetical protein
MQGLGVLAQGSLCNARAQCANARAQLRWCFDHGVMQELNCAGDDHGAMQGLDVLDHGTMQGRCKGDTECIH